MADTDLPSPSPRDCTLPGPVRMPSDTAALSTLRAKVHALADRAHVPFSDAPSAALILLRDGTWVPGVRVDSASFSLSLSALMNAVTTTVALGRADDMVALVLSRPADAADRQYAEGLPGPPFSALHDDVLVRASWVDTLEALPAPTDPLDPFLPPDGPTPEARVAQARRVAERAYTPASEFPVGALLDVGAHRLLPGVNVEHDDWGRTLCAERNALGAAQAYGVVADTKALYLSCPLDAQGMPCGACRQWLVELTPKITLWMDRDEAPPADYTPEALLPASFSGNAIPRSVL